MNFPPLLERAVLDDLRDHVGTEAMRSVIGLFLAEARELVARIAEATDDAAGRDAARRAAHSLKSGAGQLGATALSDAATQIENAAAAGTPGFRQLVATLVACAADTETAFAALGR